MGVAPHGAVAGFREAIASGMTSLRCSSRRRATRAVATPVAAAALLETRCHRLAHRLSSDAPRSQNSTTSSSTRCLGVTPFGWRHRSTLQRVHGRAAWVRRLLAGHSNGTGPLWALRWSIPAPWAWWHSRTRLRGLPASAVAPEAPWPTRRTAARATTPRPVSRAAIATCRSGRTRLRTKLPSERPLRLQRRLLPRHAAVPQSAPPLLWQRPRLRLRLLQLQAPAVAALRSAVALRRSIVPAPLVQRVVS